VWRRTEDGWIVTAHPSAHDRLGGQVRAIARSWRDAVAGAPGDEGAEAVVAALVDALLVEEPDLRDYLLRRTATVPAPTLEALTALRPLLHRAAPDPAAAEHLHRALDELVRVVVDRTVDEWAAVALIDPLTGVGNRRALEEQLNQHVARAVRHERPLSVVTVDLDGLKRLNDTQGHAAGDEAIRQLAIGLRGVLRASDTVFRIGGDEFVIVLPETDREATLPLLRRAEAIAPAFSYGVASLPEDGPGASALLAASDARLLDSKRGRRPVTAAAARTAAVRRRVPVLLPVLIGLVLAELLRRAVTPDLDGAALAIWLGASAGGGLVLASNVAAGASMAVLGAARTGAALAAAATLLPAGVAVDGALRPSAPPPMAQPSTPTSAPDTPTTPPQFALPPPNVATLLPPPPPTTTTSAAPTTTSTRPVPTTTTSSAPRPPATTTTTPPLVPQFEAETANNGRRIRAHGDPDPGWRRESDGD
jgi:diguanylate cyclase (GGDEF)-like protein